MKRLFFATSNAGMYCTDLSSGNEWHGAGFDTGAQTTVIFLEPGTTYGKLRGTALQRELIGNEYCFEEGLKYLLGS